MVINIQHKLQTNKVSVNTRISYHLNTNTTVSYKYEDNVLISMGLVVRSVDLQTGKLRLC